MAACLRLVEDLTKFSSFNESIIKVRLLISRLKQTKTKQKKKHPQKPLQNTMPNTSKTLMHATLYTSNHSVTLGC